MDQNKTISISIKLHPSLGQFEPSDAESLKFERDIAEETTVQELLETLSIPDEKVKMISLNEKLVKKSATLSEGDRLILFSTVAGG